MAAVNTIALQLQPIDTAPRDGRELLLVSLQNADGSLLISIHNGYWGGDERGWLIGQPHVDLRIGEGCATHWLPREMLGILMLPHRGDIDGDR